MKQKNKAKYHHGDLRTALINATVEMINQQGGESITMRNLSDWVGVSRTAPYRHFEDKSSLLTATAIEGFKQFSEALRAARLDMSVDEVSRFRKMGEAYIKFAIEKAAYYRLMFGNVVIQDNEKLRTASDEAFMELQLMIEFLQHSKAICCDDSKSQAIYIWSLMHGLSSLVIDNKLQADVDINQMMVFIDQMITKSLAY